MDENIDTIAPQPALRYAGFWARLAAGLIDTVFALLVSVPIFLAGERSRELVLVLQTAISVGLNALLVYMVVRYGGTPGKIAMGLRVAMTDGSSATLRAATLRISVDGLLVVLQLILVWWGTLQIPNHEYVTLSLVERGMRINAATGSFADLCSSAQVAWGVAELFSLLFSERRRSVHDLIAGTVVVHRDPAWANPSFTTP